MHAGLIPRANGGRPDQQRVQQMIAGGRVALNPLWARELSFERDLGRPLPPAAGGGTARDYIEGTEEQLRALERLIVGALVRTSVLAVAEGERGD